jgi:transcriptional antiterminator RfaH
MQIPDRGLLDGRAAAAEPHRAADEPARSAGFQSLCAEDPRAAHHPRTSQKVISALFPGYAFVLITLQWHAIRRCPGVIGLIMDGMRPARVPDPVIEGIRDRERGGVIVLPRSEPKRGDRVRILSGPFRGHLAIYAGMSGPERVAVLLQILGGQQRVTLAERDIEMTIF